MATAKQKAALEKGRRIMKRAQQIQKEGGKKVVKKTVFKRKMSTCLKEAAHESKRRKA